MKTILVPVDFTPESLNAANYAADMALHLRSSLQLLHVYQPPASAYAELPMPPVEMEKNLESLDACMAELEKKLTKRVNGKITVKGDVRVGHVRADILEAIERIEPMMVVMGTHGAGKLERWVLGSHTEWASRHLPCPLIIVPPGVNYHEINKVGLAWNYRPLKEMTALHTIRDFVKALGAELHVICIMKNGSDKVSNKLLNEAMIFQEEFKDLKTHYSFIVDKEIGRSIVEFSGDLQLDMMIVIPAKHDLLGRLLHHSQSKDLLRRSKWPLLSIHE